MSIQSWIRQDIQKILKEYEDAYLSPREIHTLLRLQYTYGNIRQALRRMTKDNQVAHDAWGAYAYQSTQTQVK